MGEPGLVVTVEFLAGTFRADPEGTAHTNNLHSAEWPPSPARLFGALVAADGTRDRCRHTDGSELEWLEQQQPPSIEASPRSEVEESRVLPRYVVVQTSGTLPKSTVQQYPARTQMTVRPGIRSAPKATTVRYVWPAVPSDDVLTSLKLRAARVGYLGAADSPVRVVVERCSPGDLPAVNYTPEASGGSNLAVVEAGYLARLDSHFDNWLKLGPSLRRSQSPGLRRLASYRGPDDPRAEEPGPIVLHYRFGSSANGASGTGSTSGRNVVRVAEAFRALFCNRYETATSELPPVISGHGFSGKGFESARFLPLPNVGDRHSDGRIHGLALWLPADTPQEVVATCRNLLNPNDSLYGRNFRLPLLPYDGAKRPWAANPKRWSKPSRFFGSAFPVVHERSHRRVDFEAVSRWCHHAGLPTPESFRTTRHPLVPGGVDLSPHEVNRKGRPQRPYGHFQIEFDVPLVGPIALGSGRHFGLGLMAPVDDWTDAASSAERRPGGDADDQ